MFYKGLRGVAMVGAALLLAGAAARGQDAGKLVRIALSDDGTQAAALSETGVVQVFDPVSRSVKASWKALPGAENAALAIAPRGALVAVSAAEQPLLVFGGDGKNRRVFGRAAATQAAFSPDGKHLCGMLGDGRVVIWNVETAAEVRATELPMGSLAGWSGNGRMLVLATDDDRLRVWFPGSEKMLLSVDRQTSAVRVVSGAFSADGRRLVTAGRAATTVWDVASGKQIASWQATFTQFGAAWLGDSSEIVDMTDEALRLWNPETKKIVRQAPIDYKPLAARFSRDGSKAIYLEQAKPTLAGVHFIDVRTALSPDKVAAAPRETGPMETPPTAVDAGPPLALPALAAAENRYSDQWRRWELDVLPRVEKPGVSDDEEPIDFSEQLASIGFSDNGKVFAAGSQDAAVFVGDAVTGKVVTRFRTDQGFDVRPAQPSPKGELVALGFRLKAYGEVWSSRGEPLVRMHLPDAATALAFAPRGSYLAFVSGQHVSVLKLAPSSPAASTPYAVIERSDSGILDIAISPTEESIAIATGESVAVWNVAKDQLLWDRQLAGASITDVAWTPDGAQLVVALGGASLQVLDVATGDVSATLPVAATAIAFVDDGRFVAAHASGKAIGLHNRKDGQEVKLFPYPLPKVGEEVLAPLTFSRNGASGGLILNRDVTMGDFKPWRLK